MERRNKISNIQVGFVTEGTVESLQPYGAFVDLGERGFPGWCIFLRSVRRGSGSLLRF